MSLTKKLFIVCVLALGFTFYTPASNPSNNQQSCYASGYFQHPNYECYTIYQCFANDGTRYSVIQLESCV